MRFELSDDQRMVQESVRRFVEAEVRPNARAWDEAEALPRDVLGGLAELGIMGMLVPSELGGAGLDFVSGTVAIEEIARYSGSLALAVASHNTLAIAHLCRAGTEEQQARWLPSLATGERLSAWALTEPASRFAALASRSFDDLETCATKRGESWVLAGSKRSVVCGAEADLVVVIARTEGDSDPASFGLGAFVVERGSRGLSARPIRGALGLRAADTADLELSSVEISDQHRLGVPGNAASDVLAVLERARIGAAAVAIGLARGSLEEARAYALERRQFGKPIADFQAIQWMLADIATELDGARLLVRRAAALADSDQSLAPFAAQAKLYASELAVRAAMKAIQIHGGYGFTRDFPVERYLRDAKSLEIEPGQGTADVQRIAIARSLLGR